MSAQCLWLSEADVSALMDLREAIEALERGLLMEARGEAQNMAKTLVRWDDGSTLHAIGAAVPGSGFAGTKTWAHTPRGATPLLILFDSGDGSLRAIVEAFALGQLRTGGISGVATRWLAAADADVLAVIGTGKQMLSQVAAVAAVRPLKRVRVFSPNAQHRAAAVQRLRSRLDLEVGDAPSVADAVEGAPIITLVTRAQTPFLTAAMVARGAHINAIGAITPDRMEFAPELLARCSQVVADSPATAQQLSRELRDYYGEGTAAWAAVRALHAVVAERQPRPVGADLTLFKAMGMGVSDLSLGIEIYEKAMRQGRGRLFPHPERGTQR